MLYVVSTLYGYFTNMIEDKQNGLVRKWFLAFKATTFDQFIIYS